MKKLTLSALAAVAVAGTSFAGPCTVVSKEYKQPCVTPCFRDQEWQLDLFYSYNDASHQGASVGTDRFLSLPETTPITPGILSTDRVAGTLPRSAAILETTDIFPAGSTVVRSRRTSVSLPQYFNDGSGGGVGLNYFFMRYVGIGVEGNWWDGCRGGFDGSFATRDVVAPAGGIGAVNLDALAAAARATDTKVTVNSDGTITLRTKGTFGNSHKSAANQVSGSLILRYPIEGQICWAPYIFGGGGGIFDGKSTGFGHVGLGVEVRVTPYMGFFTDWRWEFMGGDNGDNGFRDNTNLRRLAETVGLHDLDRIDDKSRNDVSVTRVGVRFVF